MAYIGNRIPANEELRVSLKGTLFDSFNWGLVIPYLVNPNINIIELEGRFDNLGDFIRGKDILYYTVGSTTLSILGNFPDNLINKLSNMLIIKTSTQGNQLMITVNLNLESPVNGFQFTGVLSGYYLSNLLLVSGILCRYEL